MYSISNILLIISTYQCMTTGSYVGSVSKSDDPVTLRPKPLLNLATFMKGTDCYVKAIETDFDWMPIPFAINTTMPYIIRPDQNEHYNFKHNTTFKMSCAGSYFNSPQNISSFANEISVQCLDGLLMYDGSAYTLDSFKCFTTPRSKIVVTHTSCHGSKDNRVMKVGFYSTFGFISVYKICFNDVQKYALYTWMFLKAPFNRFRQMTEQFTKYIRTQNYGRFSVTSSYGNQTNTLASILDSTELACQYIRKKQGKRYLVPCKLAARNLLYYVFESDSLSHYENTAPQWIEFNRFGWKELEAMFRKNLIRGNRDHIIITGVYNVSKFPDENGIHREFYLRAPNLLPVPEYFWKMYYDVERKTGTVFIGLNNPYRDTIDPRLFFCNTMKCPGELMRRTSRRDLVFCCSKESFEEVYGKIDPFVFERTVPADDYSYS